MGNNKVECNNISKNSIIIVLVFLKSIEIVFSIDHSPPIVWLDNFQSFEVDWCLIHQWGDACYFPNKITKNARSPVRYIYIGWR